MRPLPRFNPKDESYETPTTADLAGRIYELESRVDELMAVVRMLAGLIPEPSQNYVNMLALLNIRHNGFPLKINLPTGDSREMSRQEEYQEENQAQPAKPLFNQLIP